MTLDIPVTGDRRDFHASIYESEFAILDELCEKYQASRSKVIGAVLRAQRAADLEALIVEPRKR